MSSYLHKDENLFIKSIMEDSVEYEKLKDACRTILKAIGEDPDREGLRDTPKRMIKSWMEIFAGYSMDPKTVLSTVFEELSSTANYDQMVILRDIQFYSMCEHHKLPFFGRIHVAYLPNKKLLGVSKLARLVDVYAKRMQVQEKMVAQIADDLMAYLDPLGVGVIATGQHLCMQMRGVESPGAEMITSALRGVFLDEPDVKAEFQALLKM